MRILIVSLLVCAMMVLTRAADVGVQDDPSNSCPTDWSSFKGRCYKFIPIALSWADAEKNCQNHDANLASAMSLEEYQFIQRVIVRATQDNKPSWIGGSDAEEDSVWLWSDGNKFIYDNWCRGKPTSFGDCLFVNYGDNNCWNSRDCLYHFPSVCAKSE